MVFMGVIPRPARTPNTNATSPFPSLRKGSGRPANGHDSAPVCGCATVGAIAQTASLEPLSHPSSGYLRRSGYRDRV